MMLSSSQPTLLLAAWPVPRLPAASLVFVLAASTQASSFLLTINPEVTVKSTSLRGSSCFASPSLSLVRAFSCTS